MESMYYGKYFKTITNHKIMLDLFIFRKKQIVDDVKINVSSAREVILDEAKAYKETGKSAKSIKEKKAPKSKEVKNKPKEIDRIYIRLDSTEDADLLVLLKNHIDKFAGSTEVVLVVGSTENKQVIRIPDKTSKEDDSIEELVSLFGAENVKLS